MGCGTNIEFFNLNDVITNTIDNVRANILKKSRQGDLIKLVYHQSSHVFVEADKARIAQVIYNILHNAIKYIIADVNKERGIGIINIDVDKIDDQAIVSIKDTGVGIDTRIMTRLFEKFASKSYQGTGLGLCICKSNVEAHGGKIWAENNIIHKEVLPLH